MNYNVKRIITWENSKATGKAIVSNGMGLRATLGSLGCIQFLSNSYCFEQNYVCGGNT